MNFRVQFLDASAKGVAEWVADAFDLRGLLALIEGLAWPPDALRLMILNEGRRKKADDRAGASARSARPSSPRRGGSAAVSFWGAAN